jgi:HK97 family phage portal protein
MARPQTKTATPRRRQTSKATVEKAGLSAPLRGRGSGWLPIIREPFAGAWQQNVEINNDAVLKHFAVFSCSTLIANDISKCAVKLVEKTPSGVWVETTNPAYSPVLRKPNHYQTHNQFWESWMLSKLSNGNTYVLKNRDLRGVVTALYVLDPCRVQVLCSEDGSVFYQLSSDDISGLPTAVTVPADEIIHDRWNTFYHPLIGVSPIMAAALAATQGLEMQEDSTLFFKNNATPSGILTAPGAIANDTAARMKADWETNYTGKSRGKIAVLGDGLRFEAMRANARDSQLVEQMRWTAEVVCSVFHVPPFKIGIGATPAYNNIQALNLEYYNSALQVLIEAAEVCLDEGLRVGESLGVEFNIDALLRMDTTALTTAVKTAVDAGIMSPNEARRRLDLPPVQGGDTPYMQQQNWPLAELVGRPAPTVASPEPAPDEPEPEGDEDDGDEGDGANPDEDIELMIEAEIAKYAHA